MNQTSLFAAPESFDLHVKQASTAQSGPEQTAIAEAERELLSLADYIYGHTSLKPMSKTLYFISRCLLLARRGLPLHSAERAAQSYSELRLQLGSAAPTDDFDFTSVVSDVAEDMSRVSRCISEVARLGAETDSLGLMFNTLLRGKYEGGEGLGTYLTPEEVVGPMVDMALTAAAPVPFQVEDGQPLLFGDICGGTGRFVYRLFRELGQRGVSQDVLQARARLFDQSSFSVGMARLNFLFDDVVTSFACVRDSLTDPAVSQLRNRFALLATNPPFGTGKYNWNTSVANELGPEILRELGFSQTEPADPAELFIFRNLDLLAPGGVLAIVLPDGIVQSRRLITALHAYERLRTTAIEVMAVVSLPVVTFSLGGTVAKTSFVILRKQDAPSEVPLFYARSNNVGFLKKGNRRVPDPNGNDLYSIAHEFANRTEDKLSPSWRTLTRLIPDAIEQQASTEGFELVPLRDFVLPARNYVTVPTSGNHFHVSILDIDDLGSIDIISAGQNQPLSRSVACKSGDILISCINPHIWRAAVIPDLAGTWSCSPEFVVCRPKVGRFASALGLALHHRSVIRAIQDMAGGTSSSRQRVEKDRIFDLMIPHPKYFEMEASHHAQRRLAQYQARLIDNEIYRRLHDGRPLD